MFFGQREGPGERVSVWLVPAAPEPAGEASCGRIVGTGLDIANQQRDDNEESRKRGKTDPEKLAWG